jgi:integrase
LLRRLDEAREEFREASVARSTSVGAYGPIFAEFEDFSGAFRFVKDDSGWWSVDAVESFITWLGLLGRGGRVPQAVAAIVHFAAVAGHTIDLSGRTTTKLLKGVKKLAQSELNESTGGAVERQRDAFPVGAWKSLVGEFLSAQAEVSQLDRRDLALIGLGIRCMRRGGELCDLNCEDVVFDESGTLSLTVGSSKTDQTKTGLVIKVAPLGRETVCPVAVLWDYCNSLGRDFVTGRPLFVSKPTRRGGTPRMSVAAISSVVRRWADRAGVEGKFSSHSLRIGGVSAAVAGGMSWEQIQTIGGWSSSVVEKYARSIDAASKRVSESMWSNSGM